MTESLTDVWPLREKKSKEGRRRGCCICMWVNAFLLLVVKSRGHRQEGERNPYITWSILSVKSPLDIVLT